MAADTLPSKPSFHWDIGSGKLSKRVSQVEIQMALDQTASMSMMVSLTAQEAGSLSSRDIPQEASFKWADRSFFKGHLADVSHLDTHRIRLTFQDSLFASRKAHENLFFKQQTLQECLDKLASKLGLSTRYLGNFGETIPSIHLTGPSFFDHLGELSNEFGFYFFAKAASDQICFLKVGSHVKDVEIPSKSPVTGVGHTQSPNHYYSQVTFRHLDQHSLESKEKRMSASDLYSPLAAFRDHSGYREKTSWKHAKGSFEAHVNESYHFDSADQLVKNQLSKKLMQQESLRMTTFEPVGIPGDRLKVKGPAFSNSHEGAYLIRSCHIIASGANPRMEIEAIRP